MCKYALNNNYIDYQNLSGMNFAFWKKRQNYAITMFVFQSVMYYYNSYYILIRLSYSTTSPEP